MFDDINEKIEYEWRKWENYLYLQSSPECVSRSYEITVKRLIYQMLIKRLDKMNDFDKRAMMYKKDFIDFMYSKSSDEQIIEIKSGKIPDDVFEKMLKISLT